MRKFNTLKLVLSAMLLGQILYGQEASYSEKIIEGKKRHFYVFNLENDSIDKGVKDWGVYEIVSKRKINENQLNEIIDCVQTNSDRFNKCCSTGKYEILMQL